MLLSNLKILGDDVAASIRIQDDKISKIRANVRARRMEKGFTQKALAGKLKISQNAYCKIETGKSVLRIDTLVAIAEILEIDLKLLFLTE